MTGRRWGSDERGRGVADARAALPAIGRPFATHGHTLRIEVAQPA